jgi:hypothetical protein
MKTRKPTQAEKALYDAAYAEVKKVLDLFPWGTINEQVKDAWAGLSNFSKANKFHITHYGLRVIV